VDKDEARNQLERLFTELFESDPVSRHMQKLGNLSPQIDWDEEAVAEYIEGLKKKLL
jgi:hypothetical protein